MTLRAYLVALAAMVTPLGVAAVGCGNDIVVVPENSETGSDGAGGFLFLDGGNTGAAPPIDGGGMQDAFDEYVDPGCPNQPPPAKEFTCDPYAQGNGDCLPGEACYIFVDYPEQPCGQEVYGSFCLEAGPGTQGDSCGGGQDCASGFVCVVSGSGTQCVQLCSLTGADGCPPGLVCSAIDVEGFGGCL